MILSIEAECLFEAINITTLIDSFVPLRISVFESITEEVIFALEKILSKDL